jgi:hypothetical protein
MKPQSVDGKGLVGWLRFLRALLGVGLVLAGTSVGQMKRGDRRKAYGEARASVIESLLTTIYPGADVLWDPALMVKGPGMRPLMVEVPVYVRGSADGGMEGVATVEVEGRKEQFIFEAQSFQRTDRPVFPTELYVFRADTSGHIQRYKKIAIDPDEPLTEMKTMAIQDWSQKEWPTLEIQYDTHRPAPGSFTTIEWHGVLDANSGEFISRLPFGISRKARGGSEGMYMFGIGRENPNTVIITNRFGGESHPYSCSDPCVMDADTLLSDWKLNDAAAQAVGREKAANSATARAAANANNGSVALRLKNGRSIQADSAKEDGDKVEYTMGESTAEIPKSLVQEIVHPANAPPSGVPLAQISGQSGASRSGCEGASPPAVQGQASKPATRATETIKYRNKKYGFAFSLPATWRGYSVVEDTWESAAGATSKGPLITLKNPQSTSDKKYQDIYIMVFSPAQWDSLQRGDFGVSAASVGPGELGRNRKYVFAEPPRMIDSDNLHGSQEVVEIMHSRPLHAF